MLHKLTITHWRKATVDLCLDRKHPWFLPAKNWRAPPKVVTSWIDLKHQRLRSLVPFFFQVQPPQEPTPFFSLAPVTPCFFKNTSLVGQIHGGVLLEKRCPCIETDWTCREIHLAARSALEVELKKMNQLPSGQNPTAYLEDGLPGLGYVIDNHGEYISPQFLGLWDPFLMALFLPYKWGLLYNQLLTNWDDPPRSSK